MKNITLAIDDQTYRKARKVAASKEKSISALVREYLNQLSENEPSHQLKVAKLFESMSKVKGYSASKRLKRSEIYDR